MDGCCCDWWTVFEVGCCVGQPSLKTISTGCCCRPLSAAFSPRCWDCSVPKCRCQWLLWFALWPSIGPVASIHGYIVGIVRRCFCKFDFAAACYHDIPLIIVFLWPGLVIAHGSSRLCEPAGLASSSLPTNCGQKQSTSMSTVGWCLRWSTVAFSAQGTANVPAVWRSGGSRFCHGLYGGTY